MAGSLLEAKAGPVGILSPMSMEALSVSRSPESSRACPQLCPGQAWGYLLEWTVPLERRSLNTAVVIPEARSCPWTGPLSQELGSGLCPCAPVVQGHIFSTHEPRCPAYGGQGRRVKAEGSYCPEGQGAFGAPRRDLDCGM